MVDPALQLAVPGRLLRAQQGDVAGLHQLVQLGVVQLVDGPHLASSGVSRNSTLMTEKKS